MYGANNPLRFVDPTGLYVSPHEWYAYEKMKQYENQNTGGTDAGGSSTKSDSGDSNKPKTKKSVWDTFKEGFTNAVSGVRNRLYDYPSTKIQTITNGPRQVKIVTTTDNGFRQEVQIFENGQLVKKSEILYDTENQLNVIAVEGFINRKDYGATMLVVSKKGIVDKFTRANTLPSDPTADKIATIQEGTYRYESATHGVGREYKRIGEDGWQNSQYDALRLSNTNQENSIPATRGGIDGVTAVDINVHAGNKRPDNDPAARVSEGCQTIHSADYVRFMNHFSRGDEGYYVLLRY